MKNRLVLGAKVALVAVSIGSLALCILLQILWSSSRKQLIASNQEIIRHVAAENVTNLAASLKNNFQRLQEIVKKIPEAKQNQLRDDIKDMMSPDTEDKKLQAQVVGIAWQDDRLIRFQLVNERPEEIKLTYNHLDENEPKAEWYRQFLAGETGKGRWLTPYYGETSQTYVWEYGMPFSDQTKTKAGVAYFNYSVEYIRRVLTEMELGPTGYAFIVSKQQYEDRYQIVAHPCDRFLCKFVEEVYREAAASIKKCLRGDDVILFTTKGGETTWFYAIDIEGPGSFKLVFVLDRQAMQAMPRTHSLNFLSNITKIQSQILSSLLFCVFLFTLILFIIFWLSNAKLRLALIAVAFSLICVAEIGLIWYFCRNTPVSSGNGFVLTDLGMAHATAERLLWIHGGIKSPAPQLRKETGIFIQSLKFETPYEVRLTGYVWQKKKNKPFGEAGMTYTDDNLIVFPEAEEISISKKYENDQVIGAYFETTLRQPFDYTNFPFDFQDIWIRIWPRDFTNFQAVLVPDFDSYELHLGKSKQNNKTVAMGLERDLVLEGWEVNQTFFSYVTKSYTSNLGIQQNNEFIVRPELHFNIQVRRQLGGVMISHILPILIIAILLFGVTMTKTEEEHKKDLLGFSVSTVLAYCASLFFVLIISHISLRNTLSTPHFVYLEGFYFIMYVHLLLVSIYDIIFVHSRQNSIFRRNNAVLLKLFYWPVLSGLLLIVTFFSFY